MLASELTGTDRQIYDRNKTAINELLKTGFPLNWKGFDSEASDSPFLLTDAQTTKQESARQEILQLAAEMPDTSFSRRWLRDMADETED